MAESCHPGTVTSLYDDTRYNNNFDVTTQIRERFLYTANAPVVTATTPDVTTIGWTIDWHHAVWQRLAIQVHPLAAHVTHIWTVFLMLRPVDFQRIETSA